MLHVLPACVAFYIYIIYDFVAMQRNLFWLKLIVRDLEARQYFILIVRSSLIPPISKAGVQLASSIVSLSAL